MPSSTGADRSRTTAILAAVLFIVLGGAVLLRFGSEPESILDPQANDRAGYELDGATSELGRFLDAPVGFRLDEMAAASLLERSSDALVDAGRWRDAAARQMYGFDSIAANTTAQVSSFILVSRWRGQIGFMGHDIGPVHLGRACAQVTVRASQDDTTRASVTSEKIDCPPEAPMPVSTDG